MSLLLNMLSKLTGAYNKSPDGLIGRLFQIFAMALQSAEDTMRAIAAWREISNAKGITLDRMGRNFGVRREGAADFFFRLLIKTKITALLSGGDVDTIIYAASILLDIVPEQVEVIELFPAKCRLVVDEASVDPEYRSYSDHMASVIRRVIAAGVGTEIFYQVPKKSHGVLYTGAGYCETIRLTIPPSMGDVKTAGALYVGGALYHDLQITIGTEED